MSDHEHNVRALFKDYFTEMQRRVHKNAVVKGFWGEPAEKHYTSIGINTFCDPQHLYYIYGGIDKKLSRYALMHSELSEAVEAVRKPKQDEHVPDFTSEAVELADTIIRIMDYAEAYGIPVAEALVEKAAFNDQRPRMHGKLA